MKLVRLDSLFSIEPSQKLVKHEEVEDINGILFVSASGQNNGVLTKIKRKLNLKPIEPGKISIAISGSALSTFYQTKPFYTGDRVCHLESLEPLNKKEHLFYVKCIRKNQFRFNYGRKAEGEKLASLMLPAREEIPQWVYETKIPDYSSYKEPKLKMSEEERLKLWKSFEWGTFRLLDYFMYFKQSNGNNKWCEDNPGDIAYLTATTTTNGVSYKVSKEQCINNNFPVYKKGITITADGQPCWAFYQSEPFILGSNVYFIKPKNFKLTELQSLFVCKMIRKESFRFNYGRKLNTDRLEKLTIGLPKSQDGTPDWDLIEKLAQTSAWTNNL